ncbi:hypothetical protein V8G54_025620 [Vigna mungo]|uniref:Uncharacterized protein n=1 Tax=Vigna mungo TaxID=3915 RepID=A0AAQ3RPQ0_VIGMU
MPSTLFSFLFLILLPFPTLSHLFSPLTATSSIAAPPPPPPSSTTALPSLAPFHSETIAPYPTYSQSTTLLGFSLAPPGTPSPSPTKAPTSCASTSTPSTPPT